MPKTATPSAAAAASLGPSDTFVRRHLGPTPQDRAAMLAALGQPSLDALIDATVPPKIRMEQPLALKSLDGPGTEAAVLERLKGVAAKNTTARSMIGQGYYGTITPPVLLRNLLEDPRWYTPYTPYQAEISQGRLEALLNFQTMVSDLTGLPLAGASLLDEATAAAEAMAMCYAIGRRKQRFLVADDCHPQTIAVVQTRARTMGIEVEICDVRSSIGDRNGDTSKIEDRRSKMWQDVCGVLVQYPNTYGSLHDYSGLAEAAHEAGALVVAATDLLACCLIKPPGSWGADICVGSSQRFGVPMGYGGPHAAFLSTHEKFARKMPGRIIGVSKDAHGSPAYRMAIQTREQHIKRDKATSNICTAQVLLAITAGMYAVWHGPEGLKTIARRVHGLTTALAQALRDAGVDVVNDTWFDTLTVKVAGADDALAAAAERGINLRRIDDTTLGIALDETTTRADVAAVVGVLGGERAGGRPPLNVADVDALAQGGRASFEARQSSFLDHPVFNAHHSEHEMLRYLNRLIGQDIGLDRSMIPLGSCTMKLNAAVEMIPITWPQFANLHPYCPPEQAAGYRELFDDLESWLAACTGFDAVSLQPNAGSQGEYAGLLAIKRYHDAQGAQRDICLIPTSAHGTNPASAVIAGMKVVAIKCKANGDIDLDDLRAKAEQHAEALAALMITYPSTHGVFEEGVVDACRIVHEHGGLVYMDGANMNAQVGLTSPGRIGADVCHLNLHKTFCIPHGGGGPGMGPIACTKQLAPYLPGSPVDQPRIGHGGSGMSKAEARTYPMPDATSDISYAVSAAPFGSPMILPISWVYIALMAGEGLTDATRVAILNANYMAKRLAAHYPVLYTGRSGTCAHEFIIDCRAFEKSAHVTVEDIAKRLMDFGIHAPTMSWPVAGTMMIEPTESESLAELDRVCDALIEIRREIAAIERGELDEHDNPLKNAPHTAAHVTADAWPHTYSREQAAFPTAALRQPGAKYWPPVGRVDNPYGDRHLVCTCPPMAEYCEA